MYGAFKIFFFLGIYPFFLLVAASAFIPHACLHRPYIPSVRYDTVHTMSFRTYLLLCCMHKLTLCTVCTVRYVLCLSAPIYYCSACMHACINWLYVLSVLYGTYYVPPAFIFYIVPHACINRLYVPSVLCEISRSFYYGIVMPESGIILWAFKKFLLWHNYARIWHNFVRIWHNSVRFQEVFINLLFGYDMCFRYCSDIYFDKVRFILVITPLK